jgi:uncharacterized protein (TIGR03083 family)
MEKSEIWPVIHAERKALASDLGALGAGQWSSPSLCGNWTVRDVLAHMAATAKITPPSFFSKMLANGFSFEKVQASGVAANLGATPADTLAEFESVITSLKHPPGPLDTPLGEVLVHAEDIRRPLGIHHEYPMGAVVRVADFFKGSNLIIGSKRRIDGLTLRATDTEWSHGTGPEVSGPMLSLLMAMTGRKAALADLSGDGVATLKARP